MPAWITPLERPVWWAPIRGSAFSTQRVAPARRESSPRATAWPTMPPPTIATSHSAGARSLPLVVAKRGRLVRLAGGVGRGPRRLRQRGDLEHALGGLFEHLGRLLCGAGVELDQ